MKKLISIAALSVLTACTAPQEASSIGNGATMYDMNAVQDYNARVTSGNTVTAREKAKVAQRDSIPNEMNASDHRSKQRGYSRCDNAECRRRLLSSLLVIKLIKINRP